MVDKQSDTLKRKDLDLILEVNKKAIEIETEVAEQNEEIIDSLDKIKDSHTDLDKKLDNRLDSQDEKLDKLIKQTDDTNKDLFRMQVLFVTGLITLVAQIVEIFLKK
jgi:hypothetical protein